MRTESLRVGEQNGSAPQTDKQRRERCEANKRDDCTGFQAGCGVFERDLVRAGAEWEGTYGIGELQILAVRVEVRRELGLNTVHIGAPARLVGNGGVEKAVFACRDSAAQFGVGEVGERPCALSEIGAAFFKYSVVLQDDIERDRAVFAFLIG